MRSLLSEASSGCLIIAPLQAAHHRTVARQQHQQTGLWVADEEEEEDAAHIGREEELTFPWERELWELLSLSLSHGIPACSIIKVTGISAIAEPSVWEGQKDARSLVHGTGVQSWVSSALRGVHGSTPSITGRIAGHCHHALATAVGTELGYQTAGINHTHSFSNFKMSSFGVDDKFQEKKERSHVILQKLKMKWKATLNWKLFVQKMSWRIFLFPFVVFKDTQLNSHLLLKQTHRSASKHPSVTIAQIFTTKLHQLICSDTRSLHPG